MSDSAKGDTPMKKAQRYRKYGGMMPYLIEEYDGFNEFVYDYFIKDSYTASEIIEAMEDQFGDTLGDDLIPSANTVRTYRRKLLNDDDKRDMFKRAEAKDMIERNKIQMEVINDFNFLEQYKELYERALDGAEMALKMSKNTGMPTNSLFKALESASNHLQELDKACARYGVTPPIINNGQTAEMYISQWQKRIAGQGIGNTDDIPDEEYKEIRVALKNIGLNPAPHNNANHSKQSNSGSQS